MHDSNWDGEGELNVELLPSGHVAGLYEFHLIINVIQSKPGYINVQQYWSEDGIPYEEISSEPIYILSTGYSKVSFRVNKIYSDGSSPISIRLTVEGNEEPMSSRIIAGVSRIELL